MVRTVHWDKSEKINTNKMGKKKTKKQQENNGDDDDWDILNQAVAQANEGVDETTEAAGDADATNNDQVQDGDEEQDAAAAFLAAQGLDAGAAVGGDKKKKKKKKKPADKKEDGGETKEKVSAKGKLIAERLRLQREEEEKRLMAEEAERARIAESEFSMSHDCTLILQLIILHIHLLMIALIPKSEHNYHEWQQNE